MTQLILYILIYSMIFFLSITLIIGFLIHSHGTKIISVFGIFIQVLILAYLHL